MIPFIVLILTISLIIGIVIYVQKLKMLVSYAKERQLYLFGRRYQSLFDLFADLSFTNKLFSGRDIQMHGDKMLVDKLQKLRVLFLLVLVIGLLNQILVMINAM